MEQKENTNKFLNSPMFFILMPLSAMLLYIIFIPYEMYISWAIKNLYDWFLIPLHAPQLSFWHIYGLELCVTFATLYFRDLSKDEDSNIRARLRSVYAKFVIISIILIVGSIVKNWI